MPLYLTYLLHLGLRMARYKYIDTNPRFLAVDLARQLLPGTFERVLNYMFVHAIDLSHFDARLRNEVIGAPELELAWVNSANPR